MPLRGSGQVEVERLVEVAGDHDVGVLGGVPGPTDEELPHRDGGLGEGEEGVAAGDD